MYSFKSMHSDDLQRGNEYTLEIDIQIVDLYKFDVWLFPIKLTVCRYCMHSSYRAVGLLDLRLCID